MPPKVEREVCFEVPNQTTRNYSSCAGLCPACSWMCLWTVLQWLHQVICSRHFTTRFLKKLILCWQFWTTSLWILPLIPLIETPLSFQFAQLTLLILLSILYYCIRSPLFLLTSSVVRLRLWSLSSYVRCRKRCGTFVALLWTFSRLMYFKNLIPNFRVFGFIIIIIRAKKIGPAAFST